MLNTKSKPLIIITFIRILYPEILMQIPPQNSSKNLEKKESMIGELNLDQIANGEIRREIVKVIL